LDALLPRVHTLGAHLGRGLDPKVAQRLQKVAHAMIVELRPLDPS
jgi:hypothetical protein